MELLNYIDGDYRDPATFTKLGQLLGKAQLPTHYMAIPPSMFPADVEGLGHGAHAKNARVILEKPFGRDLASAQELDATLHAVFPESAVFRIDHYLGKEQVEHLLLLALHQHVPRADREPQLHGQRADHDGGELRRRRAEENSTRTAGAIRDVMQNHLLQVVAFLAMEPPHQHVLPNRPA